jgi:hypothetical protein
MPEGGDLTRSISVDRSMHPLDGPRAKIKRADRQVKALQASFQKFFKDHPCTVTIAEFDKKAGHHKLRIHGVPSSLPDEWGVLIGEIAHNLRSALDLLAWQLVLLSGNSPTRQTEFPVFTVGRTKRKRKGKLIPHFCVKGGLRCLIGMRRRFKARIKEFQPYKRRNKGSRSALYLLHELNIADKHRLITVLTTVVGGMQFSGHVGGGSKFKVGTPIDDNAVIGHARPLPPEGVLVLDVSTMRIVTHHEIQADVDVTPGICFGDGCDAVRRLPVTRTLQKMSSEVSRIVESFAPGFD